MYEIVMYKITNVNDYLNVMGFMYDSALYC